MSVIANAVRHMLAAGMSGEPLLAAIADMEAALLRDRPSAPALVLSPSAARMKRKRERDRASQSVTIASHVTPCDASPSDGETSGKSGVSLVVVGAETVSPSVTKRNEGVTGDAVVTLAGKKEKSPTPPKEKTTTPNPPKGGFPPSVTGRLASRMVVGEQVWLHAEDPLFLTLGGQPSKTDKSGGWYFRLDLYRRAEASQAVVPDPPDRLVAAG